MNTGPDQAIAATLAEDRQNREDDQLATLVDPAPDDAERGQTIDIVVDGRTLDETEVEALLQKPVDELTDGEREALQPLFDQAEAEQPTHVQVDPLTLAGNLLVSAIEAVNKGNGNDRRLAQQIALGHALAAHSHAAASLVVPTVTVRGNGRG